MSFTLGMASGETQVREKEPDPKPERRRRDPAATEDEISADPYYGRTDRYRWARPLLGSDSE